MLSGVNAWTCRPLECILVYIRTMLMIVSIAAIAIVCLAMVGLVLVLSAEQKGSRDSRAQGHAQDRYDNL